MQLVLITGLSGSGKSVALNALEDAGYYCVDNLPVKLLAGARRLPRAGRLRRASRVSIDVRSGDDARSSCRSIVARAARQRGIDVRVLFLDAKTDTLVKRFSETRRRHPLGGRRAHAAGMRSSASASCSRTSASLGAPHRHQRAHARTRCARWMQGLRRARPTPG